MCLAIPALIKLIEDKRLREKMGKNSFDAVEKNYSYEIIAKKFLDTVKK